MGKKKSGAGAAKDDLPPAQGKGRRRNKEIDDDEYDIGIVEEPVASANGGDAESKMKNSNDEEVDDESSQIQFEGKKKRGKKGKNAKQTEDDDDFDVAKDEDEAEDAEIAFVGKKKSKGKKGKKEDQASGFSLLSQIDGDAQAEEGEVDNDADDLDLDEMVFAGKKKSKEKKGKKAAPPSSVSAFSALGDIDNAGEVDDDDIDSVEPEAVAFTGKKKSKGKKGAKDAERGSSAFATLADIDGHGDTDEGEVNEDIDSMEPEEMVFTGKKKSKEKKGKKDPEEKVSSSTFAALAATESPEEPIEGKVNDDIHSIESEEMIFTGKKKPKGKKGKKDAEEHVSSSTFSALAETEIQEEPVVGKVNDDIDSAEPEEMVFTGKKKSKAKKGKKDLEQDSSSAYSALAEIGTDKDGSLETTSAQPDEDEMDVDGIMFTGKKKKGKKEKKQDDDVSIESTVETVVSAYVQPDQQVSAKSSCSLAIDQEITERALESVAQSKNKKKKNKKGARTAEEEENMDKLLAGLGEGPGQATTSADSKQTDEAGALPKQTEEPSALSVEEPNATDTTIADDCNAPGESAAAKKKKKKKEKEKEKKAAAAVAAEEKAAAAAAEKKDDKKIPKHVREMQERLARVKEAEEKKKREEEEKRRKEEEERLRLEELERQKEEAKRRKKEREKEKLLKKKQEGKLLTGKKKEEARRLAIMREQFLAQSGVIGDLKKEDNGVPKKPRYDTRKKKHLSPAAATEPVVSEILQVVNEYQQQPSTPVTYETPEQPEEKVVEMEEYSNEAEDEVQTQPDKESEEEEEEEEDDWDAKSWDDKDVKLRVRSAFAEEEEEEQVTKKTSKPAVVSFKAALVKGTNGALPTSTHVPANTVAPKSAVSTQENMFVKPPSIKKDSVSSTKKAANMEESTDEESDDEEEAEGNKQKGAASKREARKAEALSKRSSEDLRSPICCILGHVDTGKTKLLDCIRRTNVQEGEAGGITQQIGATYFPMENIRERTKELKADANLRVPGLLVIDTPGHESFTNLRSRGSSLCDIAILVVDIMHGLEPQTIESLNLLKMRHTPFVVALNKVDRLYGWKPRANAPIRATLKQQSKDVQNEFEQRLSKVITELKEQGLNSELYYKNKEIRKYVSIVPTSAVSGEGVPDLLLLLIQLTQKMMEERLMYISEVQCTVLEVKVIEGLGTTIDVILINGVLHEGDQIVVCGMQGPIVTNIRALLTPHPMKELRVKGSYQHHKELKAAQGIKITAQGLEHAIAGTQLYLVGPDDDVEDIKYEAMEDMRNVMSRIDKSGEGVYVQASTLGSLEALLEFLKTPEVNIPVSGIGIGPVHKKDVMRASVMLEKKKEYATILAFDVKVTPEARELADEAGVRIFMADIIYHLFDQFKAYVTDLKEEKKKEAAEEAVFPCVLKIIPKCVFNKKDPIIVGVDILEGAARVGTPLCVPSREFIAVGRISSIEINHKAVDVAKKGQQVAMKIAGSNPEENQKMVGRHFDVEDELVSHISRKSIDILKENYREDVSKEEWTLIRRLKVIFKIP